MSDKLKEFMSEYQKQAESFVDMVVLNEIINQPESPIHKILVFALSRPTCGVEQRKFLDEVEKGGEKYLNKNNLISYPIVPSGECIDWGLWQKEMKRIDLQKVIKGE